MASKKRGLGRGLESLLSNDFDDVADEERGSLLDIALDDLRPGRFQPRRDMDAAALESLAQSIRTQGVVQPLVVRDVAGTYEIVAGERRWRAARMAGLESVPAIVRSVADETAMALALIENIQREDLNPLEEAAALRRLIDECNLTHAACAEAVGRSRAAVSNLLRLTDLAPAAQELLRKGTLHMGHARALLGAPTEMQDELAQQVAARGLNVRQTEALVQTALGHTRGRRVPAYRPPWLVQAERDLSAALEASVTVQPGRGGRGRVVIDYANVDELDQLVARFK